MLSPPLRKISAIILYSNAQAYCPSEYKKKAAHQEICASYSVDSSYNKIKINILHFVSVEGSRDACESRLRCQRRPKW